MPLWMSISVLLTTLVYVAERAAVHIAINLTDRNLTIKSYIN